VAPGPGPPSRMPVVEPEPRSAPVPLWPLMRVALPGGVSPREMPVHLLVPFRKGLLPPDQVSRLAIWTQDGVTPRASMTSSPVSYWSDGSVKWLTAKARLRLGPPEAPRAVIRPGQVEPCEPRVVVSEDDVGFRVETGRLRVSLPTASGFPLGDVWLGRHEAASGDELRRVIAPGDGVAVEATTCQGGPYRSVTAPSQCELERSSPQEAVMRFGGALLDDTGAIGANYTARLAFFADAPFFVIRLSVEAAGPLADEVTGISLSLAAALPVDSVRLEDPADREGFLDVTLESDEWLSLSSGESVPAAVTIGTDGSSYGVAEGTRQVRWVNAGELPLSLTVGVIDGRGDPISLVVGRDRVVFSSRLPSSRRSRRATYELLVLADDAAALSEVAANAAGAMACPVYGLPETDYLASTGVLPAGLSRLEWFAETSSETRVAFQELTDEAPCREYSVGSLLYALLRSSPEVMELAVRRARRWLDEGAIAPPVAVPEGSRELLSAVLGEAPDRLPPLPLLDATGNDDDPDALAAELIGSTDTNERLALLPRIGRASARYGRQDLAETALRVLRSLQPAAGSAELRVLCIPPVLDALMAFDLDPDALGPDLLAVSAAEDPVLIRPGSTRTISLILRNSLDVGWNLNVFAVSTPHVRVGTPHLREHVPRRGSKATSLTLTCEPDACEGEAESVRLVVAASDVFGKIPEASMRVLPANDAAGVIGTLPAPVQDALRDYAMPTTRVHDVRRAAFELLDLLYVCEESSRAGTAEAIERAARSGCVVVCVGPCVSSLFDSDAHLHARVGVGPGRVGAALGAGHQALCVPHALRRDGLRAVGWLEHLGPAWEAVLGDESGRPVLASASLEPGAVIMALVSTEGEEGMRLGRNLVEWAFQIAGI